jgi:hypothetical protein
VCMYVYMYVHSIDSSYTSQDSQRRAAPMLLAVCMYVCIQYSQLTHMSRSTEEPCQCRWRYVYVRVCMCLCVCTYVYSIDNSLAYQDTQRRAALMILAVCNVSTYVCIYIRICGLVYATLSHVEIPSWRYVCVHVCM